VRQALAKLVARHTTGQPQAHRARIILKAAAGKNQTEIATERNSAMDRAALGRARWLALAASGLDAWSGEARLEDLARPGAPSGLRAEPRCPIEAMAWATEGCPGTGENRPPDQPMDRSRHRGRTAETRQCSAPVATPRGARAEKGGLQPPRMRDYLTREPDRQSAEKTADIKPRYPTAQERAERGDATLSTDELTGVQALSRQHLDLPMQPGPVGRRAFEYERQGPRWFIVNFKGARERVAPISAGSTRPEADVLAPSRARVEAAPHILHWPCSVDHRNTHPSASLVRSVAQESDRAIDLGVQGQSGRLAAMDTRAACRSDPTHRLGFHYTPQHASWMNQVELGFSIRARKLLKRGSFLSVADRTAKVLAFVDYFNRTMAKPFRWTDQGKALVA
jgi:DDE superfamily endonuclease